MSMILSLRRITEPSAEPVYLSDVKAHLGITPDVADDDAMLSAFIASARRLIETRLRRTLVATQWEAVIGRDTGRAVHCGCRGVGRSCNVYGNATTLPMGPLLVDDAHTVGITVELETGPVKVHSSAYGVDARRGMVYPRGGSWDWAESVVTYWAGAPGPEDVAPQIKTAIYMLVHDWYRNRGGTLIDSVSTAIPVAVDALLASESFDGNY